MECLLFIIILDQPYTLLSVCRIMIRKCLGRWGLPKMAELPLPPRLVQYLTFDVLEMDTEETDWERRITNAI